MTADTAGLQAGLSKAASSVGKFTNDVEGSTSRLDKFSSKLTGMLGPLTALVGIGGAGAFFSKGIIDASQLEKDVLAIETLTGSVEIAEQTMKDLQQFAASTPFQMGDLTQATKMLLAFGIEAENVQDNLFVLGNLAAVSGASVSELAQIFGKVKAQGKVTAETLDQLAERAIPVGPALAEHFGVAETAIRDMVSKGLVKFEDLQQALFDVAGAGGKLSEAMSRMSETTAGKFSTLIDNISMLGIEIGEAFLPVLNQITDSAIGVVQGLTSMAKTAKAIGDGMSKATGGLISFNSSLKFLRIAAFTAVIPAMIRMIKTLKNLAKAAIVAQAATGVGLVTALGSLAGAMALELGIDAIFGPIEEGAEKAGEQVGVLTKSVEDLQKQADKVNQTSAIGVAPPDAPKVEDISAMSLSEMESLSERIAEKDKQRVKDMKELAAMIVEAKENNIDFSEGQKLLNELQKTHNKELERHKKLQDEINKKTKDQERAAKRLLSTLETQADKYKKQLDEINELRKAGAITEEQAVKLTQNVNAKIQSDVDKVVEAQETARRDTEQKLMDAWKKGSEEAAKAATTNLVRAGSKEMFEQVAKAQFKKENPLATFQKKSTKIATDQLRELKNINSNLGKLGGERVAGGNAPSADVIEVGLGA